MDDRLGVIRDGLLKIRSTFKIYSDQHRERGDEHQADFADDFVDLSGGLLRALTEYEVGLEAASPVPESPDIRLVSIAPIGDDDEYSQADMDMSIATVRPFIDLFMRVPVEGRIAVLGSLVSTWCMTFDRPEAALTAFIEEMIGNLPGMFEEARRPRQ